jgi:hypothetical protein
LVKAVAGEDAVDRAANDIATTAMTSGVSTARTRCGRRSIRSRRRLQRRPEITSGKWMTRGNTAGLFAPPDCFRAVAPAGY